MSAVREEWVERLLELGRVYEVGGVVRDLLMARGETAPPKDRDFLVTGVEFDAICAELGRFGRVDQVGKSFGVLKFTPRRSHKDAEKVTHDVALPRREWSTGAGHTDFAVEYDPSLPIETDLRRRDFTINAMARDLRNGELVDPCGGVDDLRQRILRQVFPETFDDDPLRMLRAVQFAARFEFTIDGATAEGIRRAAGTITTVSPERIAEELSKLLTLAASPSIGFRLMSALGLLKHVIPEMLPMIGCEQPGGYHAYDVFEHSLQVADAAPRSLRLRWAALLHDVEKPRCRVLEGDRATFYRHESHGERTARQLLSRLRYPRALIDDVALLVAQHMFVTSVGDKGVRRMIRRMGTERIYDLLELRRADVVGQGMGNPTNDVDELEARVTVEISRESPFGLADLAVDGRDLMAELDLAPGPAVGRILEGLLESVLDDPERNSREELMGLARKLLTGME